MEKRIQRLTGFLNFYKAKIDRIMTLRLSFGLGIFVLLMLMSLWRPSPLLWLTEIALIIGFVYLVKVMNKVQTLKNKIERYQEFLQRQWERQKGVYNGPLYSPTHLTTNQEILCNDLNLTGRRSLFSFLDECLTNSGQQLLFQLMIQGLQNVKQVVSRQEKVKELSPFNWLLLKFKVHCQAQEKLIDSSELVLNIKVPTLEKNFNALFTLHIVLFTGCWSIVGLSLVGVISFNPFAPFLAYLVFSLATHTNIKNSFAKAQSFANELQFLLPVFNFIQNHFAVAPLENYFQDTLAIRPSKQLQRINSLVTFLSVQGHPMVHIVLNALCPWDYFFSWLVEKWRQQFAHDLPRIINELHEFEVLMSQSFLHNYQTQSFPELNDDTNLNVSNAIHPLINRDHVVGNDFELRKNTNVVLITGSNMSGKSTFLRTLAVNQILATMGCPVFAKKMSTTMAPVMSCMKVQDSLEEGLSTFYYEVKQVAEILNKAREDQHFICVIDEIFRGTNNKERLIGSKSVIEELSRHKNVTTFISTHDLELTKLADQISNLENWHFRDDIDEKELVFNYKIQPGPCPTTNALKILAAEGIYKEV